MGNALTAIRRAVAAGRKAHNAMPAAVAVSRDAHCLLPSSLGVPRVSTDYGTVQVYASDALDGERVELLWSRGS